MRVILLVIINMMVKYINNVSDEAVVIKKERISIVSGVLSRSLKVEWVKLPVICRVGLIDY